MQIEVSRRRCLSRTLLSCSQHHPASFFLSGCITEVSSRICVHLLPYHRCVCLQSRWDASCRVSYGCLVPDPLWNCGELICLNQMMGMPLKRGAGVSCLPSLPVMDIKMLLLVCRMFSSEHALSKVFPGNLYCSGLSFTA